MKKAYKTRIKRKVVGKKIYYYPQILTKFGWFTIVTTITDRIFYDPFNYSQLEYFAMETLEHFEKIKNE